MANLVGGLKVSFTWRNAWRLGHFKWITLYVRFANNSKVLPSPIHTTFWVNKSYANQQWFRFICSTYRDATGFVALLFITTIYYDPALLRCCYCSHFCWVHGHSTAPSSLYIQGSLADSYTWTVCVPLLRIDSTSAGNQFLDTV